MKKAILLTLAPGLGIAPFLLPRLAPQQPQQPIYEVVLPTLIFETEPNDNIGSANTVSLGDSVIGTVSTANDVDFFTFEAKSGVVVDLDVDARVNGSTLDPIITLYGPDSSVVGVSDLFELGFDNLATSDSRIIMTLSDSGSYFLEVAAVLKNSEGPYTVKFNTFATDVEPNDVVAQAIPIVLGDTVVGRIETVGDVDIFSFDVPAGAYLQVSATSMGMTNLDQWSDNFLPPRIEILRPDGSESPANANPNSAFSPSLKEFVPVSGRYFVRVSDYDPLLGTQTGIYGLRVRILPTGSGDPTTLFASIPSGVRQAIATSDGGLFVLDGRRVIHRVDRQKTLTQLPLPEEFNARDLALDGFGRLLVISGDGTADSPVSSPADRVWSVDPVTMEREIFATGDDFAWVVVGPNGDVWLGDNGTSAIMHFDPLGTLIDSVSLGVPESWKVFTGHPAFSPGGDLHFLHSNVDFGVGIAKLGASGVETVILNAGPGFTDAIAFDQADNLYTTHGNSQEIRVFDQQRQLDEAPFATTHVGGGALQLVFLRDETGGTTNRLLATNWGAPFFDPAMANGIVELNPLGARAPGVRIGTDFLDVNSTPFVDLPLGGQFDVTLQLVGGGGPVNWSVARGSLPAEVTLDRSTGHLSGVVDSAAIYRFTVRGDSDVGIGFRKFSLVVGDLQVNDRAVADQLLGMTGALSPEEADLIDRMGNGNGVFDTSDFRSWLRRQGLIRAGSPTASEGTP